MVRNDYSVKPMFHRQHRILYRLDALRENWQPGRSTKPRYVVPIEGVVDVCAHSTSETSAFRVVGRCSSAYCSFGVRRRLNFDTFISFCEYGLNKSVIIAYITQTGMAYLACPAQGRQW